MKSCSLFGDQQQQNSIYTIPYSFKTPNMLDYLFVYGTLRQAQDGSLHPDLKPAEFLSDAYVHGKLFLIADYPGIVLKNSDPQRRVRGEIYRLLNPATTLQLLDEYEECSDKFPPPHEYQRTTCIATLPDGSFIRTWIYAFQLATDLLTPIINGDFGAYLPASHNAFD